MHQIYLALGSNIESRKQHIETAIALLREKVQDITVAPLYETKPRYFEDQNNFLNIVLRGHTDLEPRELLQFTKAVQKEVGRVERFRYGPREIDVDILFYDDVVYKDEELEIPHPRLQERDFVLQPFADINPDFSHPVLKKTIRELLDALPEEQRSIVQNTSGGHLSFVPSISRNGLSLVPTPKGVTSMSIEDNKALAQRWLEEVWNQGDLSLVDELIAINYVLHDPTRPGLKGRTGIKESVASFRTAFPDLHFTIEDQVADGERVVTRYSIEGTHLGPIMGIAATGKHGTITGIDIYRITDGQIEEAWSNWDTLRLLQQMGVIPPMQ